MDSWCKTFQFDDLKDPKCDRCGANPAQAWTAACDAKTGDVREVYCGACKMSEQLSDWSKDHRLYSSATMEAAMKCYEGRTPRPGEVIDPRWFEIHQAYNRVQAHVKANFEPSVWFGHAGEPFTLTPDKGGFGDTMGLGAGRAMMPLVYRSRHSYLTSGKIALGNTTFALNTWVTAGRALVEVESETTRVTLITEDGSMLVRMGIQGIDATEKEAKWYLEQAEKAWLSDRITLREGTVHINPR